MQSGMQSGMIPPPMPGLTFPPPSLPHAPHVPATPIALPPHFPPHIPAATTERVQEVMDNDREDGEVSDADGSAPKMAGIAVRSRYPEPPRSAPQSTATPSRAEEGYDPDKPSAGQKTSHAPAPKVAPQAKPPQAKAPVKEMDLLQQQRDEAKQFIRLLNSHNIGYHALAKENVDVELLRGMYRSMNLPSEPEPIPLPKTNGTAAPKSSNGPIEALPKAPPPSGSQKAVPTVSTNIAAASAANAAPSPVDRKDYLARLQAAKLARQSGPAKPSPPHKSSPGEVLSSATGVSTPQATMTPTRKQPVTDEQKARQTELIKQRLEALKAQTKQSAAAPNSAMQSSGSSQIMATQPHTPGPGISLQQAAAPGFPGIPGLFMNAPSSLSNGTTTPSRQPQSVPQKRPAQSDTEVSTPRGSVTPYNRPFGQSPYVQQEDSMIIEVSDDESNGSEMDIDDDHASSGPPVIRQAPISIPGFPPRQAPVPAASSAVSTPGPQTPATLARTGELSTKEQELAALKLTLKKKLAEQKRIKEAAEAAAASAATHGASSNQSQTKPSQATSAQQAQAASRSRESAATTTTQAGTSTGDSSRDRKRRRRTEIQEQLPSLDDEIASNEVEMARLAKDLERLRANNERIMQDKERLTRELEDLGIDTEGMSHADMRATKNEIERAKSPEADSVPQIATALPHSSSPTIEAGDPAAASADIADAMDTASTSPQAQAHVSGQSNVQYGFLPGIGQTSSQMSASAVSYSLPRLDQSPPTRATENATDLTETVGTAINNATLQDRASATPMDDDEDFYSPPPPAESGVGVAHSGAVAPATEVQQIVADAPSPSEEGEVEMSESSEEEEKGEYEPDEPFPEEPVAEPQMQHAQTSESRAEQSQSAGQSQVSTEDEEAYEPPDVDEGMIDAAPPTAPEVEALSPGDADDGAMDIATSSSEDSEDSASDSDDETRSELEDFESQTHVAQQDTNIADIIAPELQSGTPATVVPVAAQSNDVCMLPISRVSLTRPGAHD